MGKQIERLDLECKSGSKDAVYHLQLEEVEGGFVVNYQNGRNGGTLTAGTKTKSPVTMDAAKKIFDRVAKEKLTAQPPYVRMGGSGEAYQSIDSEMTERSTGLVPQLLNDVPDGSLEDLLRSDEFVGQAKIDGHRRMVRVTQEGAIGSNRRGLQVPLPACVAGSVRGVVCEVDGELLGSRIFLFDLLSLGTRDLRGDGYEERKKVLDSIAGKFGAAVTVVALAVGEHQKRVLLDRTRELLQEGVVFKHVSAPYTPGRPNSGGSQLRFKHWKDCTVIVLGTNEDRRSVRMGVLDNAGTLVEVGSVTVPQNQAVPEAGALLDVKYLYAFVDGDLFLPTFKRVRDDLVREDAKQSRLCFKADHVDVEITDLSESATGFKPEQVNLF